MFLAAATLALVARFQPVSDGLERPIEVWRCYDEVYDLGLYNGKPVAATSGGALVEDSKRRWVPLGPNCPAPVRKIESGPELRIVDRSGCVYLWRAGNETWERMGNEAPVDSGALPQPKVRFLERGLTSKWGSRFLQDDHGDNVVPRDPADGDYALLANGDRLLAGTNQGIYEYAGGRWVKDPLPTRVPVLRPQGIAFVGPDCVVGGLAGVFVKRAGKWSQISREPVRQILKRGADVYVLYGSGAIDKLDLLHNQLLYDAINEGAKRPWTSCMATFDETVAFGGQGGWIERSRKTSENYYSEIDKDVVMAATGRGAVRWIGTQKSGLFRYGPGRTMQWNPGNGLTDTWVTALLHTPEGLYVATAGEGLFLLRGDVMQAVPSPTKRPRQLTLYRGQVVVGGMDGAWISSGHSWKALPTNGEETTAVVAGDRLVIATAAGVHFLSP